MCARCSKHADRANAADATVHRYTSGMAAFYRCRHYMLRFAFCGRGIVLHPSMPITGRFSHHVDVLNGTEASVYVDDRLADRGYALESMADQPVYAAIMSPGSALHSYEMIKAFRNLAGFGVMLIDTPQSGNRIRRPCVPKSTAKTLSTLATINQGGAVSVTRARGGSASRSAMWGVLPQQRFVPKTNPTGIQLYRDQAAGQ